MRRSGLFLAAIAVSLMYMAPALAHLLELPRKMALDSAAYFTVQQIYAGWSLFGLVLAAQLALLLWLAFAVRREPGIFPLVCAALVSLAAAQALFWLFTYPANGATRNWTMVPDNWQALRRNWEYSHAAGALLQLAGFFALLTAAMKDRR
jgi:hypothetical protein